MKTRWWIGPSIALVAIALAHCGGDDSNNATGSGGSAGSGGGSGGSSAGSKSSGTAGMGTGGASNGGAAGSGGAATGGSGGGTAGTAGAGMGGAGGSPGDGGPGGGKSDGSAGSAGASVVDAARDRIVVGDAAACPPNQPMSGDTCMGVLLCPYGNVDCACVRVGGGNGREWRCNGTNDGAPASGCPPMEPQAGSDCTEAGAGTVCRYGGNVLCACDRMDNWVCR
jgi:hypothetical protein